MGEEEHNPKTCPACRVPWAVGVFMANTERLAGKLAHTQASNKPSDELDAATIILASAFIGMSEALSRAPQIQLDDEAAAILKRFTEGQDPRSN